MMNNKVSYFYKMISFGLLIVMDVLLIVGCGDKGAPDESPTGEIAFSVAWDREGEGVAKDLIDCDGIAEVTAAVYGTHGDLLKTGGPWDCEPGRGSITAVPADRDVYVAVVGHDQEGTALYRGQTTEALYLPAGGLVETGTISAEAFSVELISPGDAEAVTQSVAQSGFELTWQPCSGATDYVVMIWKTVPVGAGTPAPDEFIRTIEVEASATPSCSSGPLDLDTYYRWAVQAVDGAGNAGGFAYRTFYISSEPYQLTVRIVSPKPAQEFQAGDTVTFQARVLDPAGNDLSADDMEQIIWETTVNQETIPIEEGSMLLSFPTSKLLVGDHTIALWVMEGITGYTGSASVSISVVDFIVGDIIVISPDTNVGTDIYDLTAVRRQGMAFGYNGDLSDAMGLQWTLDDGKITGPISVWIYPDNSGILNPTIQFDWNYDVGDYTVGLTVYDSFENPHSVSPYRFSISN